MTLKHFNVIALLLFANFSVAQISTGGEIIKNSQTPKETPVRDTFDAEFYVAIAPQYTFRTLESSAAPFGKPLGQRNTEYGTWTNSFTAGVRSRLHNNFYLDFGAGYAANKEENSFARNDTSFLTTRTYRHFAVPLKLAYMTQGDLSFYAAVGLMPKAFISTLYTEDHTYNGVTRDKSIVEKQGFNAFILDVTADVGLRVNMSSSFGVFAHVQARRQLNSNYSDQSAYIRKPYALGFNLGLFFPMD